MPRDYEPCPFCGSEDLKTAGGFRTCWVVCKVCETCGPTGFGEYEQAAKHDAIKKWNERASFTSTDRSE
jgi:Lar family restriction alleviation protein